MKEDYFIWIMILTTRCITTGNMSSTSTAILEAVDVSIKKPNLVEYVFLQIDFEIRDVSS